MEAGVGVKGHNMSFQATVLRVMIASPGDVPEERKAVTEEILRWNNANSFARKLVLLPIKWETHSTPQQGEHPQTQDRKNLFLGRSRTAKFSQSRPVCPSETIPLGMPEHRFVRHIQQCSGA